MADFNFEGAKKLERPEFNLEGVKNLEPDDVKSTGFDFSTGGFSAVGGIKEVAKGGVRSVQGIAAGSGSTLQWIGNSLADNPERAFINPFMDVEGKMNLELVIKGLQAGATGFGASKLDQDLASEPVKRNADNVVVKIGEKVAEIGEIANKFWREAQQTGVAKADPELFKGTFMENPSFTRAVAIVAEAVPSLGFAAAITFATKNPLAGAASLGLLEGSGQFSEALEAGKTPKAAGAIATAATIGSTVLEALPLGRFLNRAKSAGNRIVGAGLGSLEEGLQEGTQTIYQNLIAKNGYDETRELTEGLVEAIIGGAGSGGLVGGLTSGKAKAVDKLLTKNELSDEQKTAITDDISKQIVDNKEDVDSIITDNTVDTSLKKKDPSLLDKVVESEPFENIYQKTINRLASIENLSEQAKRQGVEVKPGEDPGLLSRLYAGVANVGRTFVERQTSVLDANGNHVVTGEGMKPILEEYSKNSSEQNVDLQDKDLRNYLIAQRIVQDLQGRTVDKKIPGKKKKVEGSIVTEVQVAENKQTLADLAIKYKGDLNNIEGAAQRLYQYQKRVLSLLVDSGDMSQEMFNNILDKNPNHVPFFRVLEDEQFMGIPVNKKRFTEAKSPIRQIQGSEKEIKDPVQSMIFNTYRILDIAHRNKVAKSVANLAEIFPDKLSPVKLDQEVAEGKLTLFKPKGMVFEYYEDGKVKFMEVTPNLFHAMTGLNEQSLGLTIKILSAPAQWLRVGATITPEFMVRNFVRDQQVAFLQTNFGFKPYVDSAQAVSDIIGRSDLYYEWIQSGGAHASFVELSRENLETMYKEIVQDKKAFDAGFIIHKAQDISQLFEQATRLGAFKAAKKSGKSSAEAAFESRESTLDFARRGSGTKEINAVKSFFNAGIQAFDKGVRTATNDPVGFFWKATATITVPEIIFYMMNRDDEDYRRLPRWQKDLFWMFKIPGTEFYARIPKPFAFGQVFGSSVGRFLEYVDGRNPEAMEGFIGSIGESLSPVPGIGVTSLIPTALESLIENATNWDFFLDRNLVPPYFKDLPSYEQFTKRSSASSRLLSIWLNDNVPDSLSKLKMSPAEIENIVQGYFGGSGRYALQGSDFLLRAANATGDIPKRPMELTDIMGVKGFVSDAQRSSSAVPIQQFFEASNKVISEQKAYKKQLDEGRIEAAKKTASEFPFVKEKSSNSLFKITHRFRKQMSALNKRIERVTRNDKLSDKEKIAKIREIEKKRVEKAEKGNAVIKGRLARLGIE